MEWQVMPSIVPAWYVVVTPPLLSCRTADLHQRQINVARPALKYGVTDNVSPKIACVGVVAERMLIRPSTMSTALT
ncbi:MAG: hypothetical protein U5K76_13730 [Woeseiaceae bacterium]|nr:hypothetical protein [Woeseiaceae bacterium]